jgi:prepilin-type processing-associated H-X9-DG protein
MDNPPHFTEKVADWVLSITPAPEDAPIYEALKSVANSDIKIVASIPEQVRLLTRNNEIMADMPNEARGLIQFAAQRVQWASASLSLQDILNRKPMSDVLLTIKTNRPSDATMLRGMMEQLIEFGVNTARFSMEMAMRDEELTPAMAFASSPLVFSFTKGLLRTLLPDVEGDKLVFRAKGGMMSSQVTVGTIGVGVALLLPAVQAAREAARRMQCSNHIKQIVLALHNYHDVHGALPPLYTVDANGRPLHSWRVLILPFIEQMALYQQIRLDEPWDSEHNSQFHNMNIPIFRCPSNPQGGTSYVAIAGEVFVPATAAGRATGLGFQHITDGTSNTLAIVEVNDTFNWMAPMGNITLDELVEGFGRGGRVGSYHPGGMNVGLFDGSVRFISETVDRTVLRALGTRAGGESVPIP